MKKLTLLPLIIFMMVVSNAEVVHADVFAPRSCAALYSTDLLSEMKDQIDSRISDFATSTGRMKLFSTSGNDLGGWTRNSSVWTAGGARSLDFTGVSPWNSDGFNRKAGTLVSPKHIVFANHFPILNGSTIIFIDSEGTVVSRTLVAQSRVGNRDIQMGILNEPVPSSIAFYPILSLANVAEYFSQTIYFSDDPSPVPLIFSDQEQKAIIDNLIQIGDPSTYHRHSNALPRSLFSEPIVNGDSGNPGFFVAGDQLILNFTHQYSSGGTAHGSFIPEMNAAMAALGGPEYQVSTFDLSCFISGEIHMKPQSFFVTDISPTGTVLGTITADNAFPNTEMAYSILSGNNQGAFSIGTSTGTIILENPSVLDVQVQPVFTLMIQAKSIQAPINMAVATATISVIHVIAPINPPAQHKYKIY